MRFFTQSVLVVLLSLPLTACSQPPVERLAVEVLARYPHDPDAFTQGLVYEAGRFFESTGQYGASSLREVAKSGEVLRLRPLEPRLFGEGLARVDDRLIQLTWRSGEALVYDADSFEETGRFSYDTEGWGLCYDGQDLYMTDGTARLFRRDPETFGLKETLTVTLREGGEPQPITELNELECVGDDIYANVWLTDFILRIDKGSGRVEAVIDASTLLSAEERQGLEPGAVLNGVAYDPERDSFYLTGKYWPTLFEVRFVERR